MLTHLEVGVGIWYRWFLILWKTLKYSGRFRHENVFQCFQSAFMRKPINKVCKKNKKGPTQSTMVALYGLALYLEDQHLWTSVVDGLLPYSATQSVFSFINFHLQLDNLHSHPILIYFLDIPLCYWGRTASSCQLSEYLPLSPLLSKPTLITVAS